MIINMEGQTKDNSITWFIQVHDCEVSSSNDSVESNIDDFFNKWGLLDLLSAIDHSSIDTLDRDFIIGVNAVNMAVYWADIRSDTEVRNKIESYDSWG